MVSHVGINNKNFIKNLLGGHLDKKGSFLGPKRLKLALFRNRRLKGSLVLVEKIWWDTFQHLLDYYITFA